MIEVLVIYTILIAVVLYLNYTWRSQCFLYRPGIRQIKPQGSTAQLRPSGKRPPCHIGQAEHGNSGSLSRSSKVLRMPVSVDRHNTSSAKAR